MRKLLSSFVLVGSLGASSAQAHHGPFHGPYGYGGGYCPGIAPQPLYHPPSVQHVPVFHPTGTHWNPAFGWHTDGHIDYLPRYVPGHYDTYYGGHVHPNPWYH